MAAVMKLCAAGFYDTDGLFITMFDFRETDVFQSRLNYDGVEESSYAYAGYDNSNYFMLLGPLFFIALVYFALILLKKLSQLATLKCSENFVTKRLR